MNLNKIKAKKPLHKNLYIERLRHPSLFDFMGESKMYAVFTPCGDIVKEHIPLQEAKLICRQNADEVLKYYGRRFPKPISFRW